MVRIHVDQERCTGAGNCASTAPELFDQREEDAVSVLLQPVPAPELLAKARLAARTCPSEAIRLTEH